MSARSMAGKEDKLRMFFVPAHCQLAELSLYKTMESFCGNSSGL